MAVESNIYHGWIAKQTAKASPAANGIKRPNWVGGDLSIAREDGSENFSDLDRFGDAVDFVNTLTGGGSPTFQAQATTAAYLHYLYFGGETFAALVASTTPAKHTFVPGSSTGFWFTFWKRVGLSQIVRQKFNDCKITGMRFEVSSGNKVAKLTPNVISLDPGEVFTTDPSTPAAMDQIDPLVWQDVAGTVTIDGVVYNAVSQYAINIDDGQAPWYGDSVVPYDLIPGNANVTVEGVTLLLDTATLAVYNMQTYGTASPTLGTKPLKTKPALGSFTAELKRGTTDQRISIKHEVPGVTWSPDLAVAPSPDGGPVEIALAGQMRKVSGQPAVRVTVETGSQDNAAYT